MNDFELKRTNDNIEPKRETISVIFLMGTPCWNRDYHRFGCEYFESKGYSVEVWRIRVDGPKRFDTQAGMYNGNNYREYSRSEYIKRLKKVKESIIISLIQDASILLPLVKSGNRYILYGGFGRILNDAMIPNELKIQYTRTTSLTSLLKKKGVGGYVAYKVNKKVSNYYEREYTRHVQDNPAKMIFTGLKISLPEYFREIEIRSSNTICFSHAFDYDRYIETSRIDNRIYEKHILYIDGAPFMDTYDNERYDGLYNETLKHRDEYFAQLKILFNNLSMYYDLPVVVAGHPHTKYKDNAFGKWDIVFNDTCRLVKDAKVVVTTDSTATNFVAFYDKPLIHIVNRWFRFDMMVPSNILLYEYIKYKAMIIEGTGFMDLDNTDDLLHPWDFAKRFDNEKRNKYFEDFVSEIGNHNCTTYEILENKMQEIL